MNAMNMSMMNISPLNATIVSVKENAKTNNSIFSVLPFPIECEGNPFGKPVDKSKSNISSMTPSQLKKFAAQCENINNQLNSNEDDFDNTEPSPSTVNSNYYSFKQLNSLKYDKLSSF